MRMKKTFPMCRLWKIRSFHFSFRRVREKRKTQEFSKFIMTEKFVWRLKIEAKKKLGKMNETRKRLTEGRNACWVIGWLMLSMMLLEVMKNPAPRDINKFTWDLEHLETSTNQRNSMFHSPLSQKQLWSFKIFRIKSLESWTVAS